MPSKVEQCRRLRSAIEQLGKGSDDLLRAGVHKSTVSQLLSEKGGRGIGAKNAARIAHAFGFSADYFLSEKPIALKDAMLLPPPTKAAERPVFEPLSPTLDPDALMLRERYLLAARRLGRADVTAALLDAVPPSRDDAHDPMYWLAVMSDASAASAAADTPPPRTTTVPKRSAG